MGWSCRADAGKTMDAWIKACVEATGSSNVYRVGGDEFFWETSRTEHADGAITGSIVKVTVKNPDGSSYCRKVGTFRIEGDGRIARAPKWLKDAAIARVGRHAVEGADKPIIPAVHRDLACCSKAEVLSCVCAFARTCPDHGTVHAGSHD